MKELKLFFSGTPKQLREFIEWSNDRYGKFKTLKQLPHLASVVSAAQCSWGVSMGT